MLNLPGPEPLLADGLNIDLGLGDDVLRVKQLEGRDRQQDQDQDRHAGPDHLDQGVVRGLGGHRVPFGVEAHHDVDQQRQNEERDDRDHDQKDVVEVDQLLLQGGDAGLGANAPGGRLPHQILAILGQCRPGEEQSKESERDPLDDHHGVSLSKTRF